MRSWYYRYRSYTWLTVLFIAVLFILYSMKRKRVHLKPNQDRGLFRFDSRTRHIQVRNLKGDLILEGDLGVNIDPSYSAPDESAKGGLHYTWGDHVILSITKEVKNCLLIDWDSISDEPFTPMDCFSLGKSFWYGGGELSTPSWPASKASIEMSPFYPKLYSAVDKTKQHYTSVMEPYWLNSDGVAIHVDDVVPLHVSLNANGDRKLCLKADTQGYPAHQKPVHLTYRLCFGSNLKSTHTYMASRFFDKPREPLSKSTTRYPVCTLKQPSQAKLERFFRSVAIRQFACGHIDVGLQENLEFNSKTFPDSVSLIEHIKSKKINVMATVDSSFSTDLQEYKEIPENFFITSGERRFLNLAKNNVANWFLDRVKEFQQKYGIDSLRFFGGKIELPVHVYDLGKDQNPGMIVHNFAKVASEVGKSSDIKVAFKTQALPLVIKIIDRNPVWDRVTGLRSLISMVLSIGILGYPFVTIGPIGGSAKESVRPEKELYIRWMQMSVFFPIMEFSIYPWQYDEETFHISAEVLDIRSTLWDDLLKIFKQSIDTGAPVIRPMWWISPNDYVTYNLNTQFMLGDIYLVAPVLWPGNLKHDVYLPRGVWREMFGKGVKHEIEVGKWVTLHVELRTVVYFQCLLC